MAERVVKVAISLPEEDFALIERLREARGQTRSGFIRAAVRAAVAHWDEEAAIAAFVEAYRMYPETEEEMALARAAARRAGGIDGREREGA